MLQSLCLIFCSWEDAVDHAYMLNLNIKSVVVPPDNHEVAKLHAIPPGWTVRHDQALAQLMSSELRQWSAKDFVESVEASEVYFIFHFLWIYLPVYVNKFSFLNASSNLNFQIYNKFVQLSVLFSKGKQSMIFFHISHRCISYARVKFLKWRKYL